MASVAVSDIGIYILTYPGDYHLSTALIRSLRYFGCDVPIMIIPGEGVDLHDNPFDVPIMATPGGFWGELGHADRKFWSFQGPYDKFIYMDSDIVCTRSLTPFISRLENQSDALSMSTYRSTDAEWRSAIADSANVLHDSCVNRVSSQLGNVELLSEFDPEFDPYARYPFNSGLFASTREAISEEAFADLHTRERTFFHDRLNRSFQWDSHHLFFGDQGRLNYLVDRLGIERHGTFPVGHYHWGGDALALPLETVLAGEAPCNFVHWAGTPRPSPSLFCTQPFLPLLTLAYPLAPRIRADERDTCLLRLEALCRERRRQHERACTTRSCGRGGTRSRYRAGAPDALSDGCGASSDRRIAHIATPSHGSSPSVTARGSPNAAGSPDSVRMAGL